MNGITKQSLPRVVRASLQQAGCTEADFPDLALGILMTRAIELSPPSSEAFTGLLPKDVSQWLVVDPNKTSGTRVSGNAMNPLGVAAAVLSAASAHVNIASCVALVVALVAACSVKITKDQAALLVALKQLGDAQKIRSAEAVSLKMSKILQSEVTSSDVLDVVKQLQALNVLFTVGPSPHHVIQCHESTTLLGHVGA
ncbi:TPA: hypothetical protein UM516_004242 [Stenotrophomonas maltophilia]|nr:hypothetical protein [Stenotrophomonas maltophilia]HEL4237896.1 hypothetical protein [Stenotrophomonas maltophilia]